MKEELLPLFIYIKRHHLNLRNVMNMTPRYITRSRYLSQKEEKVFHMSERNSLLDEFKKYITDTKFIKYYEIFMEILMKE